ncbi:hypothetical protein D9M68_884100 [compost metagenome]
MWQFIKETRVAQLHPLVVAVRYRSFPTSLCEMLVKILGRIIVLLDEEKFGIYFPRSDSSANVDFCSRFMDGS